jgi:hypothetical protein
LMTSFLSKKNSCTKMTTFHKNSRSRVFDIVLLYIHTTCIRGHRNITAYQKTGVRIPPRWKSACEPFNRRCQSLHWTQRAFSLYRTMQKLKFLQVSNLTKTFTFFPIFQTCMHLCIVHYIVISSKNGMKRFIGGGGSKLYFMLLFGQ